MDNTPQSKPKRRRRRWLWLVLFLLVGLGWYGATSDNVRVWPIRNTVLYQLDGWWTGQFGEDTTTGVGSLAGCIRTEAGVGIAEARVLVSESNGTVHQTLTAADGCYRLPNVPTGRYVPWLKAVGYGDTVVKSWGRGIALAADEQAQVDATLTPMIGVPFAPPTKLELGAPVTVSAELPTPGTALRRELFIASADGANQQTFLYTPITTTAALPTLLAVYPGTAAEWEGVSIPLAAAGYAVVGIGPEYSLDLEADIAEIKRLVQLMRSGGLPGVDGSKLAILGGSYSSLHVQQLLRDDVGFRGVVLLGPISDLFDMRRRFEDSTFIPPFDLDQALIALGWPNTAVQRYATYSSLYHPRPDMPPILLLHSRDDEIVLPDQSERLVAELARHGVATEAHYFDGMSHYLRTDQPTADLDILYAITLDFLRRELN